MDTLTHTLAGMLLGECAARCVPEGRSSIPLEQRRALYIGLLAVGSNLPDADFIYSLVTGSKLDYLLHHRGYSHTVVGLIVAAMLLYAAGRAWLRRNHLQPPAVELRWLAAAALAGPVLHVSMDATNTYGVHPFWPFDARWHYGDSVFIVEPLFWAAALPLLGLLQSLALRLLMAVVTTAALALLFSAGLFPLPLRLMIVAAMLGGLVVGHFTTPRIALLTAIAAWCTVTGVFLGAHGFAARTVADFVVRTDPQATTLDAVLTPLPSNPLCWEVILVQLHAERYRLRRATLTLMPGWIAAGDCPNRDLDTAVNAPMRAVPAPDTEQWQWYGEFSIEPRAFAELVARRCEAAAFMTFSRVPWLARGAAGWQLGDLRYDRDLEAGFSELELRDGVVACPAHMAPWREPRSDLLSHSAEP
jgi:inner membrane protein